MKEEKGITLIALVITIIVMLILVIVTISVAFQTQLFDKAGEGAQKWKNAQDTENNLDETIQHGGQTGVDNIVNYYNNMITNPTT